MLNSFEITWLVQNRATSQYKITMVLKDFLRDVETLYAYLVVIDLGLCCGCYLDCPLGLLSSEGEGGAGERGVNSALHYIVLNCTALHCTAPHMHTKKYHWTWFC